MTKTEIQALIDAARTNSADLVTWLELKAILEGLKNQTDGLILTTTGQTGVATFDGITLNIPSSITGLIGEVSGTGPGVTTVTLNNASVTGKVLTGLNIAGGAVVATDSILTAFGKVQNQINSLIGGVSYRGTWNASTNSPTITSSVGTQGHYYVVSVAGSTSINGVNDWTVGDWIIFNGTSWEKVDNTDSVVSVNGLTGAVSLTTTSINEGTNLYFTNARARSAVNLTTTGTTGAATYNSSTGVLNIPNYASIYSANGSLAANRTVSGENFTLALGTSGSPLGGLSVVTNTGKFYVELQGGSVFQVGPDGGPFLLSGGDSFQVNVSGARVLTGHSTSLVIRSNAGNVSNRGFALDVWGTVAISGNITAASLAGSGTRMVVADPSGVLSTQAIPSGGGGVPTSRTLTINGTALNLSEDRSWTITGSNGLTHSGSTIKLGGALSEATAIAGAGNSLALNDLISFSVATEAGGIIGASYTQSPGTHEFVSRYAANNISAPNTFFTARLNTGLTPQNGFGVDNIYRTQVNVGGDIDNLGAIRYSWTNISTREARFDILVKPASLSNTIRCSIFGNGSVRVPAYGSGSITGTATFGLAVDANGNIIEVAIGGGGGISGSGAAGRVTFWTGTSSIGSSANFVWDNTNNRLGVRTASPSYSVDVTGTLRINNDQSSTSALLLTGTNPYDGNIDMLTIDSTGNVGITMRTNAGGFVAQRFFGNGVELGVFFCSEATKDFVFKSSSSGSIVFQTQAAGNVRALITNGGNFLVGTQTDSGFRFDVNGTTRSQGVATFDSGINLKTRNTVTTSSYDVTDSDTYIPVSTTANAVTVNLPDATASGRTGRVIVIKKVDAFTNNLTIDGFGSQTIDGSTTLVFNTQNRAVILQSTGADWVIISTT